MESVTNPVARASVPRTVEGMRRYLLHRDRGITADPPGALDFETVVVGGLQIVTFKWTWPEPERPEAPRPDGFVFWTETAASAQIGFPGRSAVLVPITARSSQVILAPGTACRAAVQTYRIANRTVEYGPITRPSDWIASAVSSRSLELLDGGEKTASFTAVAMRLYVLNSETLIDATLPADASRLDRVGFIGLGAGRYRVVAQSGEVIGDAFRETSAGGTMEARQRYAACELVCADPGARWSVRNFTGMFEYA